MVMAIATGLALLALIGAACVAEEIPDGRTPPPATPADALYRAVAVVTGTRIETRLPGFAQCLGDVLVKVTGDHAVLADRRLARAAKHAQGYVVRFSYQP